jgi:hypothetical protein
MTGDQVPNTRGKAPLRGSPDLQTKTTQEPAQTVLDIAKLALDKLARAEHCPRLLRAHRFAMHRTEPAKPHQFRNTPRVVAVGLHRHRLERVMRVARFEQFDRKTRFLHGRVQPLRQRACLQTDPCEPNPKASKPADEGRRLARSLALSEDLAVAIHNANARVFQ